MGKANGPNPDEPKNAGKPVTRRDFVSAVVKLIALGALSHFTLLTGKSLAGVNDDWCPDGIPPSKGGKDECAPSMGNSDNCIGGYNSSDECNEQNNEGDECYSGEDDQDICPAKGGEAAGDLCRGGGGKTNDKEQDNCDPEGSGPAGGDECTMGSYGLEDDCNEKHEDECAPLTAPMEDDTCYNGTNGGKGRNGGDDWCRGDWFASDACYDGTDKQDLCKGPGGYGAEDACLNSETDKCLEVQGDPDECPGGKLPDDICLDGMPPEDYCPAQAPSGDYCPGSRASPDEQHGGSA